MFRSLAKRLSFLKCSNKHKKTPWAVYLDIDSDIVIDIVIDIDIPSIGFGWVSLGLNKKQPRGIARSEATRRSPSAMLSVAIRTKPLIAEATLGCATYDGSQ